MTLLNKLGSRLRSAWFAAHGIGIAHGCSLARGVSLERGFRDGSKGVILLGPSCELHRGVCLHAWGGRIEVARRVMVGPYAVIYGHGGVVIGEETLISMHCRIVSSNHTVPSAGTPIRSQPDQLLPVRIGRDVWLGGGVTVLGGVTIGDGCVVGAGAVVTKDLPPFSIAHGVPAQVVAQRDAAARSQAGTR